MRPKVGDLISGKYRLVRVIGDGGMGTVFEARHEYLGTAVALKFLHPELTQRAGLVARFLQEARLSAGIRSHHIAHVTDVDQGPGGEAYLVMELLQGESLQAVLDREKRLSLDTALDYTLQMLAGLDAAHAVGVVHRDLKPDNVFIVATLRGPLVKLLDFGIAKLRSAQDSDSVLTKPGTVMGTPEYMAPEQAYSSDTVDARSDVYAIGAMLYEMVLGTRPAPGDDPQQIAAFVMGKNVARMTTVDPSVSEALAQVVHRAMAPLPGDRYPSAAAFRDALVPFCRTLSLAGRLAATPAPAPVAAGAMRADDVSGIAPTLPPADDDPNARYAAGANGGARADDVRHDAPRRADGAGSDRPRAQPKGGTQAADPYQPSPWGAQVPPRNWDATEAAGVSPYVAPPAAVPRVDHLSAVPSAPTRSPSRRRGGGSIWLLIAMLVAAIGVGALVIFTSDSPRTADGPEPIATADAGATTGVAATAAPAQPAVVNAPIPPPVQPPATPPATRAPATRPAAKAPVGSDGGGAAGAADASAAPAPGAIPGFPAGPFPLPSAWPFPIPSALPFPLPSALPPFTLPGFPPAAPASSK